MRTVEAPPLHEALTREPARPASKLWMVLLLLAGAAGGAGVFALLHDSPADVPPIPLPAPAPTPFPMPAAPPVEAALSPCRRDGMEFKPRATRFACPICAGVPGPVPLRRWQMRFNGVTAPTLGLTPSMEVCANLIGSTSQICAPFSRLPDYTGLTDRLPVTTTDVDDGHVNFSIRSGGTTLASGVGRRKAGTTKYLETALCSGFVLHLDDPLTPATITIFLDEH
jgi:hypothetical protein